MNYEQTINILFHSLAICVEDTFYQVQELPNRKDVNILYTE